MNITLRQMNAFVAVAQHRHFGRAAEQLHVTPSALSMLVRELEQQLGVKLFDRTTRQVQVTDAGIELLPAAAKALADLDAAVSASRELARLGRGRVSIATSTVLAGTMLPWAIREFGQRHPGIRCALIDVAEQDIRERVRDGQADLGIGTVLDDDPDLQAVTLLEDRLALLCPERHPLAERREVGWRELADQPLIMLNAGSPLRHLVDRALASAGARVTPAFEASFSSTIISMVAAGLGVAALPINARQVSSRVRVKARPLVRPVARRRVCALLRTNTQPSPAAAAFLVFIRDYLAAGGYPHAATH